MKRRKDKLIHIFLVFVFLLCGLCINVRGQTQDTAKIVQVRGDTMILITPGQLKTINCIITDLEFRTKELDLTRILVTQQDSIIWSMKSIVQVKDQTIELKNKNLDDLRESLKLSQKKVERQKKWIKWGSIGLGCIIGGILITR